MANNNIVIRIFSQFRGSDGFAKAKKELSQFGKVGGAASGILDKLGLSAIGSGAQFAGAAAAVTAAGAAVTGAAAGVRASVSAYVDLANQVRSFANVSGASAEEASKFIALADDYGVSAESVSKSIGFLAKNLDTSKAKLAGLGAEVAVNASGNTDLVATVMNIAEAYQATTDPAQRAELASTAFGRSYQDLIPILNRSSAEIAAAFKDAERFGQILDAGDLKRAQDFSLALDDLGDAAKQLELAIGEKVVPVLTELANHFVDAEQNVKDFADSTIGKVLVPAFEKLAAGVLLAAQPIIALYKIMERLGFFSNAANEKLREQKKAHKENEQAAKAHADSLKELGDSYKKVADDSGKAQSATEHLADAQQAEVDAGKRVQDAEQGVQDARKSQERATQDAADAERELAQVRVTESARAAEAVERSELRMEDARARLTDLDEQIAKQQDTVNKARASGASPNKLHDDEKKLADLQRQRRGAVLDLNDATVDHTTALEKQRTGTDELKAAIDRATTAHDQLEQANRRVIDASSAVQQAQKDQEKASRDTGKAIVDEAQAWRDLKTARDDYIKSGGAASAGDAHPIDPNGPQLTKNVPVTQPTSPTGRAATAPTINIHGDVLVKSDSAADFAKSIESHQRVQNVTRTGR